MGKPKQEKKLCPFRMKVETSDATGRPVYSIRLRCDREECAVWNEAAKKCGLTTLPNREDFLTCSEEQRHELNRTAQGLEALARTIGRIEDSGIPKRIEDLKESGSRQADALGKIAASLERLAETNNARLGVERKHNLG